MKLILVYTPYIAVTIDIVPYSLYFFKCSSNVKTIIRFKLNCNLIPMISVIICLVLRVSWANPQLTSRTPAKEPFQPLLRRCSLAQTSQKVLLLYILVDSPFSQFILVILSFKVFLTYPVETSQITWSPPFKTSRQFEIEHFPSWTCRKYRYFAWPGYTVEPFTS